MVKNSGWFVALLVFGIVVAGVAIATQPDDGWRYTRVYIPPEGVAIIADFGDGVERETFRIVSAPGGLPLASYYYVKADSVDTFSWRDAPKRWKEK